MSTEWIASSIMMGLERCEFFFLTGCAIKAKTQNTSIVQQPMGLKRFFFFFPDIQVKHQVMARTLPQDHLTK